MPQVVIIVGARHAVPLRTLFNWTHIMPDYNPITLADAFIQAGELDDALDALNQHLEANPSDDDARRVDIDMR